jgi:hypothetical protein
MRLCDLCGVQEATFYCRGDSEAMPEHLKHDPHASCDQCDRGVGCRMVAGMSIKDAPARKKP